ncbi:MULTISPECIES: NAD(P)-dependent alcohol dehydrogenase [unclassified Streptomyces]|uniref:NAD(P)-dependent alcohol dehydrogenase n=1 Tax=unclassified Streptomyces TaxID=2593676 RepID=UPI00224D2583|nr:MULTISPECIES: NAD(P)-dependent alcohol dehydrogenase [unclassified Streptomyces]MCX4409678.1 NAD(P)-dependent alcohol dehydrogenase [Streptomyces sp. NBC_01764]MCX5191450.1 NAD(P)-dependent alcohol dehydrogenase [Streptomyces sp. NBC_00268]
MPTTVNAFGAHEAGEPLAPVTIERRDVGPHDVKLDILFCGICHSDINFVGGAFGPLPISPLVPGHEIVGRVTEIGPEVTRHQVGDLVGIGCMVNSCRECENCQAGQEQYCLNGHTLVFGNPDPAEPGAHTQGGYSEAIVAPEDFVLRVPESLDPAAAAPLLCAGITVYSPLKRFGARPGTRVAVVGLGGLGHLGVKMAKAMGADVTVLSQSGSKREAATALGADHYAVTGDGSAFTKLAGTFDIILNTVSAPVSLADYLGMLRLHGTMVNVGVTTEPMPMDVFTLCQNGRSYVGSLFGGIAETQEMLDFAAEHGVSADIELIGAKDINTAYKRILASDVRYRFVVDGSTFAEPREA